MIDFQELYKNSNENKEIKELQDKLSEIRVLLSKFGTEEQVKLEDWTVKENYREAKQAEFFFETLLRVRQWDFTQELVPINKVVKISIRNSTKELKSLFPDQEFFRSFQSRFTIIPIVLMTKEHYLKNVEKEDRDKNIHWNTYKELFSTTLDLIAVPYKTDFNILLKQYNWEIDTWK